MTLVLGERLAHVHRTLSTQARGSLLSNAIRLVHRIKCGCMGSHGLAPRRGALATCLIRQTTFVLSEERANPLRSFPVQDHAVEVLDEPHAVPAQTLVTKALAFCGQSLLLALPFLKVFDGREVHDVFDRRDGSPELFIQAAIAFVSPPLSLSVVMRSMENAQTQLAVREVVVPLEVHPRPFCLLALLFLSEYVRFAAPPFLNRNRDPALARLHDDLPARTPRVAPPDHHRVAASRKRFEHGVNDAKCSIPVGRPD